jgi:hypothetical protein
MMAITFWVICFLFLPSQSHQKQSKSQHFFVYCRLPEGAGSLKREAGGSFEIVLTLSPLVIDGLIE